MMQVLRSPRGEDLSWLYLVLPVFLWLWTIDFTHGVLKGYPPSFPTPTEPQDQFVRSDAGNLTLLCPVLNTHPSNITWYRGGVVDNQFRQEDGSYFVPNINPSDGIYASADGVEYYCTASNDFGTIRSRNATAFIAHFAGYEEGRPTSDLVDVILSTTNDRQQWVSLECAINPGSFPKPIIEWVRHTAGDPEDVVMVVEEDEPNTIRFVDDGRYLILETTSDAITDKEYYCRVTNPEFTAGRAPTTHIFNVVESFNQTVYPPNGVRVYKNLNNKTAPRDGDYDVVFGTAAAYGGSEQLFYIWLLNGDQELIRPFRAISILTLSDLDENIDPLIKVEVRLTPSTNQELVAYLHLLDPAVIDNPPEDERDALTGFPQTFTCSVSGNPMPKLKWYFNGVMIEGDDQRMIDMDGQTLTIPSPVEEDSGMYQCFAENESGTVFASWTLQVRDPVAPKVTSSYTDIPSDMCLDYHFIQQDSGPVLLVVYVTADPCPQASWFRRAPGDTVATEVTAGTSDITITEGCDGYKLGDTQFTFQLSVDVLNDDTTGFYSVSFTNAGGSTAVEETFVTPFDRARITNFSPVPNLGNCLEAGSEVDIVCENIGFPVGRVEFVKDGSPVDLSTERVTQTCDRLHISTVNVNDTGSYICRVHNEVTDPDQAESTSNPLNLMYCIVPQIVGDVTFTKNTPEEGEATTATCRWTGRPEPTVTWYKDGEELVEADLPFYFKIVMSMEDGDKRSELRIGEVQLGDAGDYACNVSNPVGFDSQTKRLEVQALPDDTFGVIIGLSIFGVFVLAGGVVVALVLVVVFKGRQKTSNEDDDLTATKNEAYGMVNTELTVTSNEAYGILNTEPEYEVISD